MPPPPFTWRDLYRQHVPFHVRFWIHRYVVAAVKESAKRLRSLLSLGGVKRSFRTIDPPKSTAAALRKSGYFDERFYALTAEAHAKNIDPLVHYITSGEARGFAPSAKFDPVFYKQIYPDIAAHTGLNALHHYVCFGKAEGRAAVPSTNRMNFPVDRLDRTRQSLVVMAHEASRTGAPILSWNIARTLSKRFNVIIVLIEGGPIEPAFAEVSVAVIKPPDGGKFHPAEAKNLVTRIIDIYEPAYVVANSAETRSLVPAFARAGIPVVALVHEFSGNTRPVGILNQVYDWAAHIVFSAKLVADASRADYPVLEVRDVSIIPQGPCTLPRQTRQRQQLPDRVPNLKPPGSGKCVLVVGMGAVQIRKGVDLFIAIAADVRRLAPATQIRFAWVGQGYNPQDDVAYSAYLAEQIQRSDIGDNIVFVDEVTDLGPCYAQSDLLLLSSRLDPLPNVAIDAMLRGIPVICFENATGIAEILASDPVTRDLVVPHIDIRAAALLIVKLARDRASLRALSKTVKAKAQSVFDMERYVAAIDRLGQKHAATWQQIEKDRFLIAERDAFDPHFYLSPALVASGGYEALSHYLIQSYLLRPQRAPNAGTYLRRPCAGFNPLIYACENLHYDAETRQDPLAHLLRSGKPAGPWSHPVIRPSDSSDTSTVDELRVVLHGHFHYPELLPNLFDRLKLNRTRCDVFLTTTTAEKVKQLRLAARTYASGKVEVLRIPNRGRDIGAFLTELRSRVSVGYDVVGHIHGKRTQLIADAQIGERWREFLWGNLIGSKDPMMDIIIQRFARDKGLGLVFADDPNLISWGQNREIAEHLMKCMGLNELLPPHFDFPVGTMFWARPAALKPLFDLGLGWDDYPAEPLPYDGTMLHAIERLLPFVVRSRGYTYATTHVPNLTR
jgi:glycosyltransferase involved in cell wall biosynthesis